MVEFRDGPQTDRFSPVRFAGNSRLGALIGISDEMAGAQEHAPTGQGAAWGIPFHIDGAILVKDAAVAVEVAPFAEPWVVFMHTSDARPVEKGEGGFISPMRGQGRLNEHAADCVVIYADGVEERLSIRRRHQIGAFTRQWGENCFQAVPHRKQQSTPAHHEQPGAATTQSWGRSQTRASAADGGGWVNWLWAWENLRPEIEIVGFRIEPVAGTIVVSAISAGEASSLPLRWEPRRKACLTLPDGIEFDPELSDIGLLDGITLDMGQVISASPRPLYPENAWTGSYANRAPTLSANQVLVEYTAHPDASFHLWDGLVVPIRDVLEGASVAAQPVAPATQRVTLRTVGAGSHKRVATKLHVHGASGEYLAPLDRHRIPNPAWFEDYSTDFVGRPNIRDEDDGPHLCTYINGETVLDLPLGTVYVEVTKGFEIKPVRTVVEIGPDTREVTIELERVLPWRGRGWVTADTHVHFLSPMTALLEGAAEGVNVVNLLASQWGELMTNVGDFDGAFTWGSAEAGGDGEWLVRVGTENRQHVLGHISLMGYTGNIITPMTTGGPDESAIGDPIDLLLTEWARQCHRQGGLVVLPHFPNPRAEHAASIVAGDIDAIEMTSHRRLYSGIDPYSLSDWYRYLNCGYLVPAVGGTDKMSASTAVGTVRTYARIAPGEPFTYEEWMDAVKRAETFVSYGPLVEFAVEGKPPGARIDMSATGGKVDIVWEAASATMPMSRVELVVNGEIRESVAVDPWQASGLWSLRVEDSCWTALLVRGHYQDKPEIIAAHSSPVMIWVEGSPMLAAADALTILEQIEGAMAYLDTVGTRKDDATYKRMRLVLESAHRSVHNRMHQQGQFHNHTPPTDHAAHR
jgi:hypothetical protein